jgi:hypothetical protein
MKHVGWIVLAVSLLVTAPSTSWASVETDLAAASAARHSVFLVVTERDASGIDVARSVASDAQKLSTETSILEMDRADSANRAVVEKYKLASVPVPLILVIASNGVAAGGALPQAVTAARLAAMVPSPAKAAFLQSLDEKKASFIVFSRDSMAGRAATLKVATDAVAALKGAASVVAVSLDADKEAGFIAEMKVDPKSAAPVVVVYNAKGQATSTLLASPSVDDLVAAATREIEAAPCCPGGRCK